MKIAQLIVIVLLSAISCIPQTARASSSKQECEKHIYERLNRYFDVNEQRADHIINIPHEPGLWQSGTQRFVLDGQVVEWIDQIGKSDSQHSIRINGELITLDDKTTSNEPDDTGKFTLNMIGQWEQIKLYKLYKQTIIAISMLPRQCTGLMCGVGAQLWYDVQTKQKTFFGTYRSDSDVKLFRFPREESYYVTSTNFRGDPHGVTAPIVIRYELQKLKSNGQFEIQSDAKGMRYFLKHTSYPQMKLVGGKTWKKKVIRPDCLEQNWLEDVLKQD